ncbi:sigma 54-interacting transcriptional regulator [Granulicella sp. dw_53]|uniref:sigma 54-interacting transcriptional regulator n=1 Tax=Granulicella sp. dw_53 TaxID=2719792 RepID=UPI001BD20CEE|nr:sigma 54-interacting transcriptional regulator [Granulicella sp. dw_53]
MTELLESTFETIWDDGTFVLSHASLQEGQVPILAISSTHVQSTPGSVAQLEHAYALREELDSAYAARPFELVSHQGKLTLRMEHPGGELLAAMLGSPWELEQFLRVAIGLAASLSLLHERGIVHKDIKPTNILVNKETGEAWLMGFGVASRLARERPASGPPSIMVGTLPYMAPEQTGRMNRSIDSRSDLYSFGITLYEMLTGVLPFTASDPMEWIHCHVARPPVPISERVDGVPVAVSAILSKLMSKNAEDRYQTATGVEKDLQRCLDEWRSRGNIAPFPLGTEDVSSRLLIPERLYGRESQVNLLISAFDRVFNSGTPRLVLVSGYSGIGKSAVVNELQKTLISPHSLFASGKVDQHKRDIPYATLAHALRPLVLRILGQSDTELARWRSLFQEAVGMNGQLIVNLIPEVELVVGKQPPIVDLQLRDSQNRFKTVLRRFLCVFAQREHPLALFLDDLQWLDTATLELLQHLLTEPEIRYFLLIGAYRSNEVSSTHPLTRTLQAIRKAEVGMDEITLAALPLDDIGRLVADTLHCKREHAESLTELVYEKTGGNPFFALQFLSTLTEQKLIVFDVKAAVWTWNLERIRAKSHTDNIVELMIDKLNRLSGATREVLKQLASLGNSADTSTLAIVHGVSEDEIHSALWEAVNLGLVFGQDGAIYTFLHDRIQEAAYALVPEEERAAVHLRIGRLLAANIPLEKREEMAFEIVNQFNRGAVLISSKGEREQVAELNLAAANRARTATDYASSLIYLATAKSLLPQDHWESCYSLTYAIELSQAECEFLTGEIAAAEERLSTLAGHAASLADKAAVTRLRVAIYTTLDQSDRALEIGLEYLRNVDIEWSAHPTDTEVELEWEQMRHLLGRRTVEELIDLPWMSDPVWRATMDVLVELAPPARFTDGNLHHLLLLRMTNLSLEYGNSDGSCYAYVCLTIVLGYRFNDYQTGFRFGRLGVDLVDSRGLDRFKARVYMCFGLLMPWTKHTSSAQEWMRRSFTTANGMGDLTYAAYSVKNLITNLFVSGVPLGELLQEAEDGLAFSRKAKFGLVIDSFMGQLTLIRALRGQTDLVVDSDDETDNVRYGQHPAAKSHLSFPACCFWIHKLQTRFFAGDYAGAIEAAIKAQDLLWAAKSFLEEAEYHFYAALARTAAWYTTHDDRRREHTEALLSHHKQLVVWAKNSPENFANRATLVAAEIARIEDRTSDAEELYALAIRLAQEQGFIQNEALANELASRFYDTRGLATISHAYLRNARNCYLLWGADGKVQQLDRLHPHLREESTALDATSTIGTPVEHLDLATVIKVSQALSGEIVLEKLIQTLMRSVVEHAGAERALLIIPQGDTRRIEAEATTSREGITVRLVGKAVTSSDLPESILKYVVRTQETVILDDALAANLFSSDSYIAQRRVRSILCLPLIKQAMVVGILHLESSTTSYAFTPDRIEVLKLLTSQAAISIENARLYTDLQASEDRLRLAIDTIPAMVWSNSADGSVKFINRRWQEYTGLLDGQALGKGWLAAIHPDDVAGAAEIRRQGLATGTSYEFEARIRRADGVYRCFLVRLFPLRDDTGNIVGWYGSNADIEDRRRAEEALQIAFEEIKELKDELYRENIALKEEIEQSSMFEEIVGSSPALETVLNRVSKVAPTDSTVLITGETGTGKELIARAIHKASLRSQRPFVSVNCAAIPQALIASELFGHEKGAFTGAQQRRLGRFELADGGTVFLDEIGELPLETQIALLRVLQEREFERVGGNRLIRTDVRVITATNRDLQAAIADGTFRSDFFYRLNVFPIELPPLRERKEDIPMLVESFIDRFARKAGKKIRRIRKTTMDRLMSYSWPGNIRELQNVIERSVIICETEDFTVDESWLDSNSDPAPQTDHPVIQIPTDLSEKELIEAALAASEGRVSGPSGAAIRLNMPASTLDYKIRNLKIDKYRFKPE